MALLPPAVVNLRQWLAEWTQQFAISVYTLKRMLKRVGFRWKRVRKSLKDQQDAVMMAFFTHELALLKEAHRQGELSLWFYDETGLGLNPSGLYAWQHPELPARLPAQRGQGFTVAGFLTIDNQLQAYSYSGPTTAQTFIHFVDDWIRQYPPQGKTVLVLDNVSFHRSAEVVARQKDWAAQRVYLQYLPAYGSELNLIEILWHRLKHEWLELADYASSQSLRKAVERILSQVGQKYTITFA
jgi:transposase